MARLLPNIASVRTRQRQLGEYTLILYPSETVVSYTGSHPLSNRNSLLLCCINGGPILNRQDGWKDILFFGRLPSQVYDEKHQKKEANFPRNHSLAAAA